MTMMGLMMVLMMGLTTLKRLMRLSLKMGLS